MLLTRLYRSRLVRYGVIAIVLAATVALASTWRPAIAPIAVPLRSSFSPALVERGSVLAKLGDCAVCHTADGGAPLSGSRPLGTPFGILYSDNLTPDPQTGIGRWSAQAFRRAMKEGVSRGGSHLYPALPYDHFTHITDGDLDALYAFLMTRQAVYAKAPPNRLIPPLGFRPLLAGWKMLFLHEGSVHPEAGRSPEWNRGAYLSESLAHCGACHTPRNLLGAEERSHAYAGGDAEGWHAPALDKTNPAARRWSADALYTFLRTGLSPDHSAAGGPMGPVIEGLSSVPEDDVRDIATYIASKMASEPSSRRLPQLTAAIGPTSSAGAVLFAGACAGCHGAGAPMLGQGRPSLEFSSDLRDDNPTSAVQAVLRGIEPPVAGRGPKMPPFAESFTDTQVAEVLSYVRAIYTDRSQWPGLKESVRKARQESDPG